MCLMNNQFIFGFFDSPSATVPAYDPGLGVACPVCGDLISKPMVTTSFLRLGDDKSYFYRVHKECSFDTARMSEIESAVVDAKSILGQAGNQN